MNEGVEERSAEITYRHEPVDGGLSILDRFLPRQLLELVAEPVNLVDQVSDLGTHFDRNSMGVRGGGQLF